MPTLQVRELPEDVYRKLRRLAEAENRSLAQETIVLLRKALGLETSHQRRRKALLELISATDRPADSDAILAEELVRQDRDR